MDRDSALHGLGGLLAARADADRTDWADLAIDELRGAMATADRKAPWITALIRINRASGAITAEFDDDDPDRWSVELGNLAAAAESLRPS